MGSGPAAAQNDFAGLVDIGGGRKMYLECRGTGSPVVVLVSGLKGSAGDWDVTAKAVPSVFSEVGKFTRVWCAYDRPGTPVGEKPSRSDAVPQRTTAEDAVADLHGAPQSGWRGQALRACRAFLWRLGCGALCERSSRRSVRAGPHRRSVRETSGCRDARAVEDTTPADGRRHTRESRPLPALERNDPDRSFAQVRAAQRLRPMPLGVLSADRPWGPQIPSMIAAGILPAEVQPDFGYVTDNAQKQAQEQLARLVPNAKNSGHEIHKEQPRLVIDAIREIVEAARDPASWPSGGAIEADDSAGLVDMPAGARSIWKSSRWRPLRIAVAGD